MIGFFTACRRQTDARVAIVGRQSQVGGALWSHDTIHVKPTVQDPHLDQAIHPGIIKQVINVRTADTRADPRHHFIVQQFCKPSIVLLKTPSRPLR